MFSEFMNKTIGGHFGLRSPKGMFGIEIETEGVGLPAGGITPHFVGKVDGSLRNGMEYVSNVLPYEVVHERVNELRNSLQKHGARVAPTYRSSTHIHVNFCDRTFRDVLGMTVLWALLEPVVFRLMPPGRDGSLFCVSSYDAGELSAFTDRFCGDIAKNFPGGFQPRGKYSSLNLTRLGPSEHAGLGTLEFRVFPSCLEGEKIQEWCGWLYQMSQVVTKTKDDSFLSMVRYAEQNPVEFLKLIFGGLPIPEYEAGSYVDFGARTAYEMARVIDRHLKSKKNSAKKSKPETEELIAGRRDVLLIDEVIPDAPAAPIDWAQVEEVGPAQPANPFRRAGRPLAAVAPENAAQRRARREADRAARRQRDERMRAVDQFMPIGEAEDNF